MAGIRAARGDADAADGLTPVGGSLGGPVGTRDTMTPMKTHIDQFSTECGESSLVEDHGHVRCVNPTCPKADLGGFTPPGVPRPQRG